MTQTQCTLVDLSNFCLKVSVAQQVFYIEEVFSYPFGRITDYP